MTPRKRPSQTPPADGELQARARLVREATALFAERGFANVSVRDICQAAETSLPTLYYYFKDKEGLFTEVVRGAVSLDALIEELQRAVAREKTTAGRLRGFTATYLLRFPDHSLNSGFYLRETTGLDPESAQRLRSAFGRIADIAQEVVTESVRRGDFAETDIRLAVECLLGMMNRFVFQRVHFGRRFDHREASGFVCDFFMKALAPRSPIAPRTRKP